MADVIFLLARILFASIFIGSAVGTHFTKQAVEYARAYRAPMPEVTVPGTGVVIGISALMIVLGTWADLAAIALAVFLIVTGLYMHAFWRERDPMQRTMQQVQFMKNVGLVGGALAIFYAYNQLQHAVGLSLVGPLFPRL